MCVYVCVCVCACMYVYGYIHVLEGKTQLGRNRNIDHPSIYRGQ